MKYFWVRIYDYDIERDSYEKGTLLDEFYIKGEEETRDTAKELVKEKYNKLDIKFAKPRKKNGIYAIIMDSDEFYYDWFYKEIDTICFYCHKHIKGKWRDFPKRNYGDDEYYFCSYECKNKLDSNLRYEGEFQEKESISENIAGYIYHMYNRVENKHYIGQTMYLPFFRWQEHIKSGGKGNITDITFDVITEVRCSRKEDPKKILNNIEAWWINKYIEEGYDVFNVTVPRLTIDDYKNKFNEMIKREVQEKLI